MAGKRGKGPGSAGLSPWQARRLRSGLTTLAVALGFALFSLAVGDRPLEIASAPTAAPVSIAALATADAPLLAAAPTPDTEPPPAPATETVHAAGARVWLPVSGARYHATATCSGMKNAREATLEEALGLGFTPCARCGPSGPDF